MMCAAWRAFPGSFVLFLLSSGAGYYEEREALSHLRAEGLETATLLLCLPEPAVSDWWAVAPLLLLASVSVAAGGAVRWWRAEVVGEPDVRALVLGIGRTAAAANVEAIAETQDEACEEVPPLTEASLTPADAHAFEHFDEHGRSPLERVLAQY